MSVTSIQLEAGGLLPIKSKVDSDATEEIVARDYRHPALGDRAVVRLTSDRLGEAEDLAMEFLGFESPSISKPIAIQERRSLGFAAWALVNDPDNARYALNLVKRMKAAARKAKSKPGHAWDVYTELAKELGRSVRHFLPPYWEEVGRTYKDLGNQTYAGRALTKSLEAERVHALESDRARRRDVVLEFVLAGCLAGKALSDYA
ncbi:MAG TPA: DNA-binding protein, partial [Planctomycetaceae bacterium]|nr:DNA-binding protein [Planctomycetaceae bacterium]